MSSSASFWLLTHIFCTTTCSTEFALDFSNFVVTSSFADIGISFAQSDEVYKLSEILPPESLLVIHSKSPTPPLVYTSDVLLLHVNNLLSLSPAVLINDEFPSIQESLHQKDENSSFLLQSNLLVERRTQIGSSDHTSHVFPSRSLMPSFSVNLNLISLMLSSLSDLSSSSSVLYADSSTHSLVVSKGEVSSNVSIVSSSLLDTSTPFTLSSFSVEVASLLEFSSSGTSSQSLASDTVLLESSASILVDSEAKSSLLLTTVVSHVEESFFELALSESWHTLESFQSLPSVTGISTSVYLTENLNLSIPLDTETTVLTSNLGLSTAIALPGDSLILSVASNTFSITNWTFLSSQSFSSGLSIYTPVSLSDSFDLSISPYGKTAVLLSNPALSKTTALPESSFFSVVADGALSSSTASLSVLYLQSVHSVMEVSALENSEAFNPSISAERKTVVLMSNLALSTETSLPEESTFFSRIPDTVFSLLNAGWTVSSSHYLYSVVDVSSRESLSEDFDLSMSPESKATVLMSNPAFSATTALPEDSLFFSVVPGTVFSFSTAGWTALPSQSLYSVTDVSTLRSLSEAFDPGISTERKTVVLMSNPAFSATTALPEDSLFFSVVPGTVFSFSTAGWTALPSQSLYSVTDVSTLRSLSEAFDPGISTERKTVVLMSNPAFSATTALPEDSLFFSVVPGTVFSSSTASWTVLASLSLCAAMDMSALESLSEAFDPSMFSERTTAVLISDPVFSATTALPEDSLFLSVPDAVLSLSTLCWSSLTASLSLSVVTDNATSSIDLSMAHGRETMSFASNQGFSTSIILPAESLLASDVQDKVFSSSTPYWSSLATFASVSSVIDLSRPVRLSESFNAGTSTVINTLVLTSNSGLSASVTRSEELSFFSVVLDTASLLLTPSWIVLSSHSLSPVAGASMLLDASDTIDLIISSERRVFLLTSNPSCSGATSISSPSISSVVDISTPSIYLSISPKATLLPSNPRWSATTLWSAESFAVLSSSTLSALTPAFSASHSTQSSLPENIDLSSSHERKTIVLTSNPRIFIATTLPAETLFITVVPDRVLSSSTHRLSTLPVLSASSWLMDGSSSLALQTSMGSAVKSTTPVSSRVSYASDNSFISAENLSPTHAVFTSLEPCWITFYTDAVTTHDIASSALSSLMSELNNTPSTRITFSTSIPKSSFMESNVYSSESFYGFHSQRSSIPLEQGCCKSSFNSPPLPVGSSAISKSSFSTDLLQVVDKISSSVSTALHVVLGSVGRLYSDLPHTFASSLHAVWPGISSVHSLNQSYLIFKPTPDVNGRSSDESFGTSSWETNARTSYAFESLNERHLSHIAKSSPAAFKSSSEFSASIIDAEPSYAAILPSITADAFSLLGLAKQYSNAVSSSQLSPTISSVFRNAALETDFAAKNSTQALSGNLHQPIIVNGGLLASLTLVTVNPSSTSHFLIESDVVSGSANSLFRSAVDFDRSSLQGFHASLLPSQSSQNSSIVWPPTDTLKRLLTSTLSVCLVYYTSRVPASTKLPLPSSPIPQEGQSSSYSFWEPASSISLEPSRSSFSSGLSFNQSASFSHLFSRQAVTDSFSPYGNLNESDYQLLTSFSMPFSGGSASFAKSDAALRSTPDFAFLRTTADMVSSLLSSEAQSVFPVVSTVGTPSLTYVLMTEVPLSRALIQSTAILTSASISVPLSTASVSTVSPVPAGAVMLKIEVPITINLNNSESNTAFVMDMERKLLDLYIFLERTVSRRRRAVGSGNYSVEILRVTRLDNSIVVGVEFRILDRGSVIPASNTADRMNELSVDGLSKRIGYNVLGVVAVVMPPTLPPEYVSGDIVAVVLSSLSANISSASVLQKFQSGIATYYMKYNSISKPVYAQVTYIKHEYGSKSFVEFYIRTGDGRVHNATVVSNFFRTRTLVNISDEIGISVLALPYASNLIKSADRVDQLRMRFKAGAADVSSMLFVGNLTVRLAQVYTEGKYIPGRARRATGSVEASILAPVSMVSGRPDESEVFFYISDQGSIVRGAIAGQIMSRISLSQMASILGVQVVLGLEPIVGLPLPAISDPDYWLMAAVLGPVVAVIMLLVLIYWRWRSGGPKGKIAPAVILPSAQAAKAVPSKPPDSAPSREELEMKNFVPSFAARPTDETVRKPESELGTTVRRKVEPQAIHAGQASFERKSRAYGRHEDDEEQNGDDENDDDDVEEEQEEAEEEEEEEEEGEAKDDGDERYNGGKVAQEEKSKRTPHLNPADNLRPPPVSTIARSAKLEVDQEERTISRFASSPRQQHVGSSSMQPVSSEQAPVRKYDHPVRFDRVLAPSLAQAEASTSRPAARRQETLSSDGNFKSRLGELSSDDAGDILSPVPRQDLSHSAGHMPLFGQVRYTPERLQHTPLRFRANVEPTNSKTSLDPKYTTPAGPLPVLDLHHTSLVAAPPELDSVLKQKADIERLRNKQRQRDMLVAGADISTTPRNWGLSESRSTKLWKHEQEKIEAVLDPTGVKAIPDLSSRKARLRKRLRRKHTIDIAPNRPDGPPETPDVVRLTRFQQRTSSPKTTSQDDQTEEDSVADSEISIREARKRIHDLLDDTFSALKSYEKKSSGASSSEQRMRTSDSPSSGSPSDIRHARAAPFLREAPHGAMLPPTGYEKPANPNPYTGSYGSFSARPPIGEPLIIWDPVEKQRFLDQRYPLPMYGPIPGSSGLPYGPIPNMFLSPVRPRYDGYTSAVWNPYPFEQLPAMAPRTALPGDASETTSAMSMKAALDPHVTTIDTTDKSASSVPARDSQPLIRAIRDELVRLSQAAQGRTRIRELNPSPS